MRSTGLLEKVLDRLSVSNTATGRYSPFSPYISTGKFTLNTDITWLIFLTRMSWKWYAICVFLIHIAIFYRIKMKPHLWCPVAYDQCAECLFPKYRYRPILGIKISVLVISANWNISTTLSLSSMKSRRSLKLAMAKWSSKWTINLSRVWAKLASTVSGFS